jgi:hypothetical protein
MQPENQISFILYWWRSGVFSRPTVNQCASPIDPILSLIVPLTVVLFLVERPIKRLFGFTLLPRNGFICAAEMRGLRIVQILRVHISAWSRLRWLCLGATRWLCSSLLAKCSLVGCNSGKPWPPYLADSPRKVHPANWRRTRAIGSQERR